MWSIAVAALLDITFSDPPNPIHPTAWMGTLIGKLWGQKAPTGRAAAFLKGVLITLSAAALFAGAAWFIQTALLRSTSLPPVARDLITGALLYTTFSFRKLIHIGSLIRKTLSVGDLPEARRLLSWHLVSRDTRGLSESEIAAATLESLSENITDSITAPLFYFLLFGLPGAFAYRVINTCDAMLGYHDREREWLGKFPARLDDLLNLIPARFSALIILLAGLPITGRHRGLPVLVSDHGGTESPNAGWTMAALAGVLGVSLKKQLHYDLNRNGKEPDAETLHKGIQICRLTGIMILLFFQGSLYVLCC
jgi:adenosylcobinamide-phosphate synthase